MSDRDRKTDLVALRNPIWWVALLLLLVNDHWLKGAEIAPGWLTGKLSDFAGLIVAPVLISALLMARSRRRRALAFLIVGGWFTAANLFSPVAEATSAAASLVGLGWTFWVDSTDLVALAVLPLAWQIASHRGDRLTLRSSARAGEKLALGLGLAACIASPQPPDPGWTANAFVHNATERTLDVRVRWLEATVDCAMVRDRHTDVLARDAFGPGTVFNLAPGATLPLDRGVADPTMEPVDPFSTPPAEETGHVGSCDVVMISTDGLPERMVYWDGLTSTFIPEVVDGSDDERTVAAGLQLLPLGEDSTTLWLSAPESGYFIDLPLELYDGGDTCREYGTISGFDWSDLPVWNGETVRLVTVRPTIDGCVQVGIEPTGALASTGVIETFVCVPPEDFPFLPNSEVQIWSGARQLRMVRDLPTDDGSSWRTGELIIVRGVDSFDEGPFRLSLIDVDADCMGVRDTCGGFRMPAAGGLTMGTTTQFVHPGDAVERDAEDGRRARLRVGRAERMFVTHPACGAGRDELGPRLEALVVYGEEPR